MLEKVHHILFDDGGKFSEKGSIFQFSGKLYAGDHLLWFGYTNAWFPSFRQYFEFLYALSQ